MPVRMVEIDIEVMPLKFEQKDVLRVIEFYIEAINAIEKMNRLRFMFTNYKFLIAIDKSVYDAYNDNKQ
jgi:hypothetical protein